MPSRRLTSSFVRTARCPETKSRVDYFDAALPGFMLEVRATGSKTYFQRYTDERGRQHQFKVGPAEVLTLQQARRKAKEIKAQAILGGDPQQDRQKRRAIPTLRAFVDEQYLPHVKSYKASWKTDETFLRIHILPVLGSSFLDEIATTDVAALVEKMRDGGYSPGSVARVIIILRYVFNLSRKWSVLPPGVNPASGIPVPADVQRNRYLNKEESARLLHSIRVDDNQVAANAITLLFLTGARRNEITQAQWSYIDWQRGTLFVPKSKNGQSRYVVLNKRALQLLTSLPRDPAKPYIFPAPSTGRPMPHLFFPWNRIRKRAGLPDVRLHDLRHSFASQLVNNKKELYFVQRLLGHKNSKSTQRYAHLSNESLTEAAEVMTQLLDEIDGQAEKSLPTNTGEREAR